MRHSLTIACVNMNHDVQAYYYSNHWFQQIIVGQVLVTLLVGPHTHTQQALSQQTNTNTLKPSLLPNNEEYKTNIDNYTITGRQFDWSYSMLCFVRSSIPIHNRASSSTVGRGGGGCYCHPNDSYSDSIPNHGTNSTLRTTTRGGSREGGGTTQERRSSSSRDLS